MRIAIVSVWFSERMGYSDNCLAKALATLGHDVHVVASNGQVYFDKPSYKDIFEPFLGPPIVECGTKKVNGYTLHRLPHGYFFSELRIKGLIPKLKKLKPNVVISSEYTTIPTYEIALGKILCGCRYQLYTECHIHASVFPLAKGKGNLKKKLKNIMYKNTVGRFVGATVTGCYPISKDAAEIAHKFLGMPKKKIREWSLGVDTDLFYPVHDHDTQEERKKLRKKLGFNDTDIVCIYTGRLDRGKAPTILAEAVAMLRNNGHHHIRALFVGNGESSYMNILNSYEDSQIHPFVTFDKVAPFYRAADIAVWPKQESTSQLDAIACGLPLILSDTIHVTERIDGNGLLYKDGDPKDLAHQINTLLKPSLRKQMGELGVKKALKQFSWKAIARNLIKNYQFENKTK